MYRVLLTTNYLNQTTEHIFYDLPNGGTVTFLNQETDNGPEQKAYLAWLAEGNEPEVIEASPSTSS